jgi:hypothetical protein
LKDRPRYGEFFWKAATLAAAVACSIAIIALAPVKYGYHFASIIDKYEIVRREATLPKPLIVFTGGSGLWCGLDSSLVSAKTGYNVANTGLYREFGLIFIPREALALLRKGDVIVIVPEYHILYESTIYPVPRVRKWLLAMSPTHALKDLYSGWADAGALLNDVASLCQYKIVGLVRALSLPPFENPFGKGYVNYSKKTDRLGDGFAMEFPRLSKENMMNFGSVFPGQLDPEIYRKLNELAAAAKAKGVVVFFSFPAIPTGEYEHNRAQLDTLCALLKQRLDMPVIGSPSDFTLGYDHFTDSIYHLDDEGKIIRTRKLTRLIQEQLRQPVVSRYSSLPAPVR